MATERDGRVGYIPALDGLRALSLIAILLYHGGYHWARGGYLGVTVFFTLSGFLITSLLVTERERTGAVRLRAFWGRRARRLVPAVLGMFVLVILMIGNGVVRGGRGLVSDAVATGTWSANWRFIFSGQSYANLFGNPSPFQHMWSLAVEEQFYLLLPIVVLLCFGRRRAGTSRLPLAVVLVAAAAASTFLCTHLFVQTATARAYFGTDTRVAEPLIGALLALALYHRDGPSRLRDVERWALDVAAVAAVGGLVVLMVRMGEYDPRLYHGGFLLAAVLAAVVVAASTQPRSVVARALSAAPLTALGKISYGGYVYHWPIFIWLSPQRTGLDGARLFGTRVLVTVLVSSVSYALLERPVRTGFMRPRVALGWWAPATLALIVGIGTVHPAAVVPSSSGLYDGSSVNAAPPPPPVVGKVAHPPALASARPTATAAARRTAAVARSVGQYRAAPTAAAGTPAAHRGSGGGPVTVSTPKLRIAVIGDSMANNLAGGLQSWEKTRSDVVVYNLSILGCPIVFDGTRQWPNGYVEDVPPQCAWWQDPQSTRSQDLQSFDPDVILLQDGMNMIPDRKVSGWPTYFGPGDGVYDNWAVSGYQQAINTFTQSGHAKVVLLNAVCADWANVSRWEGQGHPQQRADDLNVDYRALTAVRYSLQDLNSVLCPNGQFTNTVDGVPNARPDGYHLSSEAALAVARDWLGPMLLQQ